jgi:FtsP/CotA-like multicopper oxidase with cupredoxin domain
MQLDRRQFLIAAGVAGSALAGGCAGPLGLPAALTAGQAAAAAQPAPAASGPERRYELTAQWRETTLDGTPVRLRTYNGEAPGPTLEVLPGETLRILLRNELTPYDSSAWTGDHNVPHHLDHTNLHVHGMEVIPHLFQPLGTGDPLAEMIEIHPGHELEYTFHIPDDHPPGLYWYHPHFHGATAVQAVSGMAGAIVVRGPIDEVPEIAAAREILLVVNDIGLFPSEDDPSVYNYEPVQNSIWDTLGSQVLLWNAETGQMEPAPHLQGGFSTGDYKLRYFLINGQPFFKEEHNFTPTPANYTPPATCPAITSNQQDPIATQLPVPRFTLQPREVVRFRLLNANSDDLMPLVVEGHDLYLLALDGVNFEAPRQIAAKSIGGALGGEQLLLAPANRAEFLLQAGAPGVYKIVQLEQCAQFLRSVSRTLAEIEVAGEPIDPPMALPTTLPIPSRNYPLITAEEIVRRRNIVFSMSFPGVLNPIVGLDFMVNNMAYDELAVPIVVQVGTAEEWNLQVPDAHHGGTEGHPFHIHVNSFEVISINGVAQPPGTLMDTIWVPAGGEVVIRQRFQQWTGKTVFHCHILPHEDTGMMQNVLITDAPSMGAH